MKLGPVLTRLGDDMNEVLCEDEESLMFLISIFDKFENEKLNAAIAEDADWAELECSLELQWEDEEWEPEGYCDNVDVYGMLC